MLKNNPIIINIDNHKSNNSNLMRKTIPKICKSKKFNLVIQLKITKISLKIQAFKKQSPFRLPLPIIVNQIQFHKMLLTKISNNTSKINLKTIFIKIMITNLNKSEMFNTWQAMLKANIIELECPSIMNNSKSDLNYPPSLQWKKILISRINFIMNKIVKKSNQMLQMLK